MRLGEPKTRNVSRKLSVAPAHPATAQWRTFVPKAAQGPQWPLDQEALNRVLGPTEGFRQVAEAAGPLPAAVAPKIRAQPGRLAIAPAASCHEGASASAAALPGEDWRVDLEDDAASVFSVEEPELGGASGPRACPPVSGEAKRKRHAAPTDQAGLGPEVEATAHRRRGRRRAQQAYYQFRVFTNDVDSWNTYLT